MLVLGARLCVEQAVCQRTLGLQDTFSESVALLAPNVTLTHLSKCTQDAKCLPRSRQDPLFFLMDVLLFSAKVNVSSFKFHTRVDMDTNSV